MNKLQAIDFINMISGTAVYPCEYCARKGFDNSCTDYCSHYRDFIRSEAKKIEIVRCKDCKYNEKNMCRKFKTELSVMEWEHIM